MIEKVFDRTIMKIDVKHLKKNFDLKKHEAQVQGIHHDSLNCQNAILNNR